MLHLVGDNLDYLPDRELPFIAAIVYLSRRRVRLIDRQQYRVREVPGIPVRHQAEPAFRQDHERTFVERAANYTPFAR